MLPVGSGVASQVETAIRKKDTKRVLAKTQALVESIKTGAPFFQLLDEVRSLIESKSNDLLGSDSTLCVGRFPFHGSKALLCNLRER
jgi:hypothetical protein